MKHPISFLTVLILTATFPAFLFSASEFSLEAIKFPESFQITSSSYQIDSRVKESDAPGFLKFHVTSPHAQYDMEGLANLKKLLHEIEVIEQILKNRAGTGDGVFDGAADSIEATGEGFVNLVSHPVDSAKGIGKAARKLGQGIGGIFRKKESGEKSTFSEKMLGSSERELAKQFGVDVYSENPNLQAILKKMAHARLGGKGIAAVGTFLVPVSALVSAAVTASGVNSAADQLVNDKDRADLFLENKKALLGMGFQETEAGPFLNSNYFSPREATYFRFYLEQLKEAEGALEILKRAAQAKSVWDARKILYEVQMAAEHVSEMKYQKITCLDTGLLVEAVHQTILMTPFDYLDRSALGDQILSQISKIKTGAFEIWNAGQITKDFSAAAFVKGVKTRAWILFS